MCVCLFVHVVTKYFLDYLTQNAYLLYFLLDFERQLIRAQNNYHYGNDFLF